MLEPKPPEFLEIEVMIVFSKQHSKPDRSKDSLLLLRLQGEPTPKMCNLIKSTPIMTGTCKFKPVCLVGYNLLGRNQEAKAHLCPVIDPTNRDI